MVVRHVLIVYYIPFLFVSQLLQKCNERRAMAEKGHYKNEEEKEKWLSVIHSSIISSDSSGEDEGEEVIIFYPLPWVSENVSAFKKKLDEEIAKQKSPQARQQMKRRVIGPFSGRLCPTNVDLPSWAIVE